MADVAEQDEELSGIEKLEKAHELIEHYELQLTAVPDSLRDGRALLEAFIEEYNEELPHGTWLDR